MVSRAQDTMVSTKFNIKPFPIRHSSLKLCYIDFLLATSPQLYLASISIPLQHYMHSLSSLPIHLCIYVSTPCYHFLHLCHPLLLKLSPFTHIFHFFLFHFLLFFLLPYHFFLYHFLLFLYHFFLFNFPRYIQLFATRETPPPWTSRPFE